MNLLRVKVPSLLSELFQGDIVTSCMKPGVERHSHWWTRRPQLLREQALGLCQGKQAALRLLGRVLLHELSLLRRQQWQRQAPRHRQSAPLERISTAGVQACVLA